MTNRFDGNTIKLNEQDYARWQKAFKNIPNLDGVLQSRDDWLTYDAETSTRKRWFLSTSAYLSKQDRQLAMENRRDESGRKLNRDGSVQFKTLP